MIRSDYAPPPTAAAAGLPLTRREMQILCLLLDGADRRSVACRLGLSPETVKGHCRSLYAKLNVPNRHHLAKAVIQRLMPGRDFWSLVSAQCSN